MFIKLQTELSLCLLSILLIPLSYAVEHGVAETLDITDTSTEFENTTIEEAIETSTLEPVETTQEPNKVPPLPDSPQAAQVEVMPPPPPPPLPDN